MVGDARRSAADRLTTPWWYHPVLGLLLAAYVMAFSSWNRVVISITVPLVFVGIGALVYAYRRRTGVWISGFSAGRASRWAYAVGGLAAICMVAAVGIAYWTSLVWPSWCLAAVAWLAVIVIGRKFDTAVRAQLRGNL